jgi:Nucleotidyltransferase domain
MAQMTLNQLIDQLKAIYGAELVAVALYGSAARGEHLANHSDLNVLVVVERITMDYLRKESPVARSWREAGNPPPLTLTRTEWLGSADIFPMEYADILAHHKVLAGTLPLDGLKVSNAELRLQLEHEAMSKLLRLRHAVLVTGKDTTALRELLEQSVSTMLVLLRATLRLHGEEPPADSETVCVRASERAGINFAVVARIVRHTRSKEKLVTADVEGVVEQYLQVAGELAAYADRHVE